MKPSFVVRGLGLLAFMLAAALPAQAQTSRFDVKGVVVDSAGVGIRGATVVALTLPDSTISKFDVSAGDGSFTLRRVAAGEYVLQVTFIGFTSVRRNLSVAEAMDVGTIKLTESISELDELVVSSDHIPFVVKKDTLEYVAGAFGVRPNATVEDLLKRLPGIEVEKDGSIKAQGEQVQKVLVDGKEFFGSDPTIATRNLPAEAVNKVQVFDKQSDMAEFTGVKDGQEQKTINLQLKPGAKHGYFGTVAGGVGDTERYDSQVSINRFSPVMQLAVIGNLNNVNRQGFSFGDYMTFMGGGAGMMTFGGGRDGGPQIGTSLDDGFSKTTALGLNASREFGKNNFLRTSYFLSSMDNTQDRESNQQQLLGANLSSLQQGTTNQASDNLSHRFNLNGRRQFSEGHDITLRGNFQVSNSDLTNSGFLTTYAATGLTQNTSLTDYRTASDNVGGSGSLTWRKRLNQRGRSLVFTGSLNLNDTDQFANLASRTGLYSPGDVVTYEEILQEQRNLGNTLTESEKLSFTEPLRGGRMLEAHVERRAVNEDQDRTVNDVVGGALVPNARLSSGLDRTYTYYRAGASFRRNGDKLSFGIGADAQQSSLEGVVTGRPDNVSNGYTNLLPFADVSYQFKMGSSINLRYMTSTREPSMTELQPFEDNSNPLSVYVGNPALKPEYRHSLNAHYMLFDQFTMMNLFTFMTVSYTKDAISRSRTVDPQARQTVTSVNSDGNWTMNGQVSFGTPIRPIGAKLDLTYSPMFSRGLEILNGDDNRTNTLRNSIEARIGNRTKETFDVSVGARYSFNNVKYTLNPSQDQSYVNRSFFGDLSIYFGDTWTLQTELDLRTYDQQVFGKNDPVALVHATLSRYLFAQKAEIQLSGRDLLDQNQGVTFSNTGNYISEDRVTSLGRYLMLKFVYHLSGTASRGREGVMVHRM